MASASMGALLTSLLMTPLDVVKTRLQAAPLHRPDLLRSTTAYASTIAFHASPSSPLPPVPPMALSGTVLCEAAYGHHAFPSSSPPSSASSQSLHRQLSSILRAEGLPALYRGLSPTLLMSIPSTAIYFVGYEHLRSSLSSLLPDAPSSASALLAGGLARATSSTCIAPLELIRTRMQAVTSLSSSVKVPPPHPLRVLKDEVLHQGLRVCWRGLGPTLWRDVPFSAIYWVGVEEIRSLLLPPSPPPPSSSRSGVLTPPPAAPLSVSFIAGALSGMVAATLTTPFDVAKTRLQVATSPRPSMTQVLREIWHEEGPRGWMRGLGPRVIKVAPACAIMIGSYEAGKNLFAS
ncbi:MAG: mitochondrial carrier domain-containing protein [Piptocephalis tieghemiana]|nr:MAG: mitochondrial carrier domain-containing protein [Piptocephalis tieghemiana]